LIDYQPKASNPTMIVGFLLGNRGVLQLVLTSTKLVLVSTF
jgi:hypothetical protein